jgi:hypothetical protein
MQETKILKRFDTDYFDEYHSKEDKNPYINGLESKEWKTLRKKILKRDKYKCQILRTSTLEFCNLSPKTKILNIHHIDENPYYNQPENLITLCQMHHEQIHKLNRSIDTAKNICGKVQLQSTIPFLLLKRTMSEIIIDFFLDNLE